MAVSPVRLHQVSQILPLPLYNKEPISQAPLPPPSMSQLLQYHEPYTSADAAHAQLQASMQSGTVRPTCACARLNHGYNWPEAKTITPFWLCTPAWNPAWSATEVEREECRRLLECLLSASYTTYRASMGLHILDLSIVQPSNVSSLITFRLLHGLTFFFSCLHAVQECVPRKEPHGSCECHGWSQGAVLLCCGNGVDALHAHLVPTRAKPNVHSSSRAGSTCSTRGCTFQMSSAGLCLIRVRMLSLSFFSQLEIYIADPLILFFFRDLMSSIHRQKAEEWRT